MARLLVLEDDETSFAVISAALESQHTLIHTTTVADAISKTHDDLDLLLIDIGLPDGDGYQYCDWVRSQRKDQKIPIIFISAKDSVESRVMGFSVGGDDYIGKPFNVVELKARVTAKLRKVNSDMAATLEANGVVVDLKLMKAFVREDNQLVDLNLTPIELKILNTLIEEPNKVFPRDVILDLVWGKDIFVYSRSVDTHVSKLRKKLGNRADLVCSVHGTGYKFVSPEMPLRLMKSAELVEQFQKTESPSIS